MPCLKSVKPRGFRKYFPKIRLLVLSIVATYMTKPCSRLACPKGTTLYGLANRQLTEAVCEILQRGNLSDFPKSTTLQHPGNHVKISIFPHNFNYSAAEVQHLASYLAHSTRSLYRLLVSIKQTTSSYRFSQRSSCVIVTHYHLPKTSTLTVAL